MNEVGFQAEEDGTVWMEWTDFRRYFDRLGLCDPFALGYSTTGGSGRGGLQYRSLSVQGQWVADRNAGGMLPSDGDDSDAAVSSAFAFNPHFLLRAEEACAVHLTLCQPRAFGRQSFGEHEPYTTMVLYLLDPKGAKSARPRVLARMQVRALLLCICR